jgi:tetratricopeptide (TPR) repeat protein
MGRRYHAFVSYSHADRKWADWLFKRIESYRIPRHLIGQTRGGQTVPKRITPLFKDREELASSSDLSGEVERALTDSGALIVICSPNARESHWVNLEIERYRELGNADRIFPFIVEGDENTAFPPALLEGPEPLAANVARDHDGRENASLKIIAALLGISFDELKQRDVTARYRRLRYLTAASLALVVGLAGLATWAVLAEREAALRRSQADGLIEFMIGDLRRRLEPIGRLDVLDDVGREAQTYFATIDPASQDAAGLARRGKVSQQLGEVRLLQGDPAGSLPIFEDALAIQQEAFERSGDPAIRFDLAQANFWVGNSHWESGDLDAALPYLQAYRDHSGVLAETDPDNIEWQLEVAYADVNLGTLNFQRERYDAAVRDFSSAIDQLEALQAIAPGDERIRASLSNPTAWLAGSYWELGDVAAARATFARQVAFARAELQNDPEDYNAKELYVLALQRHGLALLTSGQIEAAGEELEEALHHAQALIERESDNFYWRYAYAKSHWYLGRYHMQVGASAQAREHLLEARDAFPDVTDAARPKWVTEAAELAIDLTRHYLAAGKSTDAAAEIVRAHAFLDAGTTTSSHQSAARAEALLLQACVNGDVGDELGRQLQEARADLARFDRIRRQDFVAVKAWIEAPLPLSRCPAGNDDAT